MTHNSFARRSLVRTLGAAGVVAAAGSAGLFRAVSAAAAIPGPASYSPTWASVDQHPPAPEWFQDAKFGIYFHWGAFSVPAFVNEWYPRNMWNNGSAENNHHKSVYGDPSVWPYHNFINGARDRAGNFVQFAPRLVSAGGAFDPAAWAQLFADAGARYAGPVAEHHDGFSMWNSSVNEYNSVARGPRLDLLRLHADAIRGKGLKLLVAMHHAYNFTGYYQFVPAQSDPSLRKLYGQLGAPAENQLWYDKLREIIDGYQPDILAGLQPRRRHGGAAAQLPVVLLQPGGRLEQGGRRHVQGRLQQPGRGLRLRTGRTGRHPDSVLAHRRQRQQYQLGIHRGHRLLRHQCRAARPDRPGEQEREHGAQHRPDGRRHHPVRPAQCPAGPR